LAINPFAHSGKDFLAKQLNAREKRIVPQASDVHRQDLPRVFKALMPINNARATCSGPPANTIPSSRSAARSNGARIGIPISAEPISNIRNSPRRGCFRFAIVVARKVIRGYSHIGAVIAPVGH
jgi:hypothetical protein